MLKMRVGLVVGLAFALGASLGASDNWTRFRGPNGLGVSDATNLPVDFGPTKGVRWKTTLPPGHSSPVLTNSHIFLTAHSPEKDAYKLFVLALDRKSGKPLWQHEVPRVQPGRRENERAGADRGRPAARSVDPADPVEQQRIGRHPSRARSAGHDQHAGLGHLVEGRVGEDRERAQVGAEGAAFAADEDGLHTGQP